MNYMGSKRKYKKQILPIINKYIKDNNITNFIDCFCGGANLLDEIICENLYGNDLSPSLIALHKQAQTDFSALPQSRTREDWDEAYSAYKRMKIILKDKSFLDFTKEDFDIINYDIVKMGALEWYSSFSCGGFSRGYAKDSDGRCYYTERKSSHFKQTLLPNYKKINFTCGDYKNILNKSFTGKCLLYCDSPYYNATPYQIETNFNFTEYYNWLEQTSKIYPIFVSEQFLPEQFDKFLIWEKEANRTVGKTNDYKVIEKLWLIDNRE